MRSVKRDDIVTRCMNPTEKAAAPSAKATGARNTAWSENFIAASRARELLALIRRRDNTTGMSLEGHGFAQSLTWRTVTYASCKDAAGYLTSVATVTDTPPEMQYVFANILL